MGNKPEMHDGKIERVASGREEPTVEPMAFEEALGRLDEVVSVLEEGKISLEEALTLYEEGVRMAHRCQQLLDTAELRLQRLVVSEDGGGSLVLESFILGQEPESSQGDGLASRSASPADEQQGKPRD
jgi:exodeoxyribonuclease VII small subunit